MKDYLVLIRGGDARMAELSPEENAEYMQKWTTYMGSLAERGHLAGGLPLAQDCRLVTKDEVSEAMVLTQGGESIGGYLLFKAESYEQAVELGKDCPVFEFDGNLEIREAFPM